MSTLYTNDHCEECPNTYDLCEVRVYSTDPTVCNGSIICEGFKFTSKLKAEAKKNCSCYEPHAWVLSDVEYEWEITNPCDYDWFDHRFKTQLKDKYSLSITGYAMNEKGNWVEKETLTGCIIEETGREYGSGIQRSIKGKALHHKILDKNYKGCSR